MLLKVTDHYRISDIQDKFNECFPFLKLEFYHAAHDWKEGSPAAECIQESEKIGHIRTVHNPEILDIKSWHRTGDVEQLFRQKLGLNVQIFRLDGNRWLQSTESDVLTLRQQSDMAEASQQKQKPELPEYDEIFQ